MDSEKQMVPVTITYAKPGARPPVFVAGSFSQPAWEEMEMQHMTRDNGDYVFTRDVEAEDGSEIRYKFRMGSEKGWVIDEGAPSGVISQGHACLHLAITTNTTIQSSTRPAIEAT